MTPSTEQEREAILDKLEHWRFNVELECSGASLCEIESIAIGGAVLKLSELHEILEWASSVCAALVTISELDHPRPVGKSWFPDGRPSKHDTCTHGEWMYESCDNCIAEFAAAVLNITPESE